MHELKGNLGVATLSGLNILISSQIYINYNLQSMQTILSETDDLWKFNKSITLVNAHMIR